MTFKIEKGIPFPVNAGRQGPSKYPFRDMEIGDSLFVPGAESERSRNGIGSCARAVWGKGAYAIRAVEGGARVWRLK